MMMPSIFGENLFDNIMDSFGFPTFASFPDFSQTLYGKPAKDLMKTDVQEKDGEYVVDIDLPGFQKDEIKMQLDNGYLTVSAAKELDQDEKNDQGNYVRRERYAGSMSRRFYVGKRITEEDIHPKYENGILTFRLPKEEPKAVEEQKHYIAIEG